jgi:hypothetical protein
MNARNQIQNPDLIEICATLLFFFFFLDIRVENLGDALTASTVTAGPEAQPGNGEKYLGDNTISHPPAVRSPLIELQGKTKSG